MSVSTWQTPATAPPTPDENEADAVELEEEAATKKDATAAAAAAPPAALALPRLTIAPESLMAIAPTLHSPQVFAHPGFGYDAAFAAPPSVSGKVEGPSEGSV